MDSHEQKISGKSWKKEREKKKINKDGGSAISLEQLPEEHTMNSEDAADDMNENSINLLASEVLQLKIDTSDKDLTPMCNTTSGIMSIVEKTDDCEMQFDKKPQKITVLSRRKNSSVDVIVTTLKEDSQDTLKQEPEVEDKEVNVSMRSEECKLELTEKIELGEVNDEKYVIGGTTLKQEFITKKINTEEIKEISTLDEITTVQENTERVNIEGAANDNEGLQKTEKEVIESGIKHKETLLDPAELLENVKKISSVLKSIQENCNTEKECIPKPSVSKENETLESSLKEQKNEELKAVTEKKCTKDVKRVITKSNQSTTENSTKKDGKQNEKLKKVEEHQSEEISKAEEKKQIEEELKLKKEEMNRMEKEKQLEDDRVYLAEYTAAARVRVAERATMRAANITAAAEKPELNTTKLDSSLKKNTAFIKKLRNFTENQYPALAKEQQVLNLSRYVEEAAVALLDARLKMSDAASCVALCSAMHQRYHEFSAALLAGYHKILKEKPDGKAPNLSKLRVDLRVFAELVAAGVFSQKEGLPLLGSTLTSLVNNDKAEHRNVAVLLSFCRHCGEDYMGLLPARAAAAAARLGVEADIPKNSFLPRERHKNVRHLMKDYYASLIQHVQQQCKVMEREERHNRRLLETRGEVEETRLAAVAAAAADLDKLHQATTTMAEYLHEPAPPPIKQPVTDPGAGEEGGVVVGEDGIVTGVVGLEAFELWEDEDMKAFYTNLPQLRAILPYILYSESEKASMDRDKKTADKEKKSSDKEKSGVEKEKSTEKAAKDKINAAGTSIQNKSEGRRGSKEEELMEENIEGEVVDANQLAEKEEEDEKQETEDEEKVNPASSNKLSGGSQKVVFAGFVNTLLSCISRDMMDAAALEFCLKFNTKPFRRKLARALFLVPRHRQDILPFYARLIASLQPLMPDLPQDLIDRLHMDFRYQIKKKDQVNLESKVKVCRFLGELVKFGVVPGSDCLTCLRLLLRDFRHHHVEMACVLLETAGRFLYRTPSTHHRMKAILEQIMRMKTAMSFEARYNTMIENAYYYVNPPETSVLQCEPPLPPRLRYIKHLFTERLCRASTERILKLLRKLDWRDEEEADFCVLCLSAAWDIKFYNIRFLASLLSGLVPYHDWLGPAVVDAVLEDVRTGLEANLPRLNQRRIATLTYLAELYNYKVVDSAVIFKVLYSLITFGAGGGEAGAAESLESDPPEHLLRLRLVVTLLDTCGAFFSSGNSKRKLDCFITYFQHYYLYKCAHWSASEAFPIEYEQAVTDCLLALRPNLVLFQDIQEAIEAVHTLNTQLISRALQQAPELKKLFTGEDDNTLATIAENDESNAEFSELLDDDDDDDDDGDERARAGYNGLHFEQSQDDPNTPDPTQGMTQSSAKEDALTGEEGDASPFDSTQQEQQQQEEQAVSISLHPIKCDEDDEFLSAFERMLSDTMLERSRDTRHHNPTVLGVPPSRPRTGAFQAKKTYDQLINENKSLECSTSNTTTTSSTPTTTTNSSDKSKPNIVNFLLMSRGKKSQPTTIAIPEDSDIVTKIRRNEKEEQEERENVKRVTLEITERQEEEEAALELLMQQRASVVNVNRERRVKYQHPKGAPDADLIFGSGGRQQRGPQTTAAPR